MLKIVHPHAVRAVQLKAVWHRGGSGAWTNVDNLRQMQLPGITEAFLPLTTPTTDLDRIAGQARHVALASLAGGIDVDVVVFDRRGRLVGRTQ